MNPLQSFHSELVHFNAHRRIDRISIAWWRIGVVCYILGRRKNWIIYTKSHGIVPKLTHVKNIQCDSDFDVKSLVLKTMEYSLSSMAILHHSPGILQRSTNWTIWSSFLWNQSGYRFSDPYPVSRSFSKFSSNFFKSSSALIVGSFYKKTKIKKLLIRLYHIVYIVLSIWFRVWILDYI